MDHLVIIFNEYSVYGNVNGGNEGARRLETRVGAL